MLEKLLFWHGAAITKHVTIITFHCWLQLDWRQSKNTYCHICNNSSSYITGCAVLLRLYNAYYLLLFLIIFQEKANKIFAQNLVTADGWIDPAGWTAANLQGWTQRLPWQHRFFQSHFLKSVQRAQVPLHGNAQHYKGLRERAQHRYHSSQSTSRWTSFWAGRELGATVREQLNSTVRWRMANSTTQGRDRSQTGRFALSLINLWTNGLLRILPQECGTTFDNWTIRAMAVTDDLMLPANSVGLQHLIRHTTPFSHECGMTPTKPHTLVLFTRLRRLLHVPRDRVFDESH